MNKKATKFEDVYEGFEDNYFRKSLTLHRLAGLERISFSESQVIGALISFKHGDRDPFPSVATLAYVCGIGDRAVNTALNRLRNRGWIVSKQRGPNESNVYDLSPLFDLLKRVQTEAKEGTPSAVTAAPKVEAKPAPAPVVEPAKAQAKPPQVEAGPHSGPYQSEREALAALVALSARSVPASVESAPKIVPEPEAKGMSLIDVQMHYVERIAPYSVQAETLKGKTFDYSIGRGTWLAFSGNDGEELYPKVMDTFKTKSEAKEWIVSIAKGKPAAKPAPVNVGPEIDPDDIIADYKARAA